MERHEWTDGEGRRLAVDVRAPLRVARWEAGDGSGRPTWWEGEMPLGWAVAEILRLADRVQELESWLADVEHKPGCEIDHPHDGMPCTCGLAELRKGAGDAT